MRREVVIFSALYPPHMGGVEVFTQHLARTLSVRGNSVVVVTNDTNGLGAGIEDDGGVKVLRLPCRPLLRGRFPLARKDAKARELWHWLESRNVYGVLVNARFYPHSLAGMKFARSKGVRPVVLDHGSAYLSFSNPALDPIVQNYERAVTARGKRYAPAYYGISKKSAEWLGEFGIIAEGVIPNSIDAAAYRAMSSGRDFRAELGLDDAHLMVAFVGRFIPEKGVASLLEASKSDELAKSGTVFVMAGDGPLASDVEKAQGDTLKWVGRLSAPDVSAFLQQADLLCLPTRSEGFSTTLLEAAACGCPAVVTDVGGARELIPDDAHGTILPSMSAGDVETAIANLAMRREVLDAQSSACRKLVEETCSWDATAAAVEGAIARAAESMV